MPPLPPSDIRRGLVASTWEGAFAQVFITLTSGVFLVDFARRRLGADEGTLGLLTALPFLAQTIQVATAWLYERPGDGRRNLTAWTLLASRFLWVVPAAMALGWGSGEHALEGYLAVVGVSALLATTGTHGWTSWMADLVPSVVRGRYFGLRNAVAAAVSIAAAYAGGLVLDKMTGGDGFAAVYAAAAFFGVLAWLAILRQHHPKPRQTKTKVPFRSLWREVWAKPENRRIFAFFTAWNVGLGAAAPFWQDYMRSELRMEAAMIGLQNTIGAVLGVFLAPWWGRLVDRYGMRPVLLANAIAIAGIPFLWLACSPGRTFPVWIDSVVVGVFWTGFNLTALNVPLSAARARGGAVFLGVFSALTGLAMGLTCIAAGLVARSIGAGPHEVLGLTLSVQQVMFLFSGVLRIASLPLAFKLPDPRAKSLVFLFQGMGYAVRHRLGIGRQILAAPWKKRG